MSSSASYVLFLVDLTTNPELLTAYSDKDSRDQLFAAEPTEEPADPPPESADNAVVRARFGQDLSDDEIELMRQGNFNRLFRHLRDNPRPTTSGDRIGT